MEKIPYKIFLIAIIYFCVCPLYSQSDIYIPYRKSNLWGFADTSGKIIIQPIFDLVKYSNNNLFIVGRSGFLGVVNIKGKKVLPIVYKNLEILSNGLIFNISPSKIGRHKQRLFFPNGKELSIDGISNYRIEDIPNLISVENNEQKWGLVKMKNIDQQKYHSVLDEEYDIIYVRARDQEVTAIKNDVREIYEVDAKKDLVKIANLSYPIELDEEQGFEIGIIDAEIKRKGHRVMVKKFWTNVLISFDLSHGSRDRVMDTLLTNFEIVDYITLNNDQEHTDFAIVKSENQRLGLLDYHGNLVLDTVYNRINNLIPYESNGNYFFIVKKGDKWGMVDTSQKEIFKFKYDSIYPPIHKKMNLEDGMIVKENKYFGLLNSSEEKLVPIICDSINLSREYGGMNKLILVKDNLYGLFQWEHRPRSNNRFPVRIDICFSPKFNIIPNDVKFVKDYPLVIFKNDQNQILGYGDQKGIKYFED